MQTLIIRTIYTFMAITVVTAALALIGIVIIWLKGTQDLPYLKWITGICLAQIIGITLLFTKKGMKYLPEVHIMKSPEETLTFMENFITAGSNATILSNRASWLLESESLINVINNKIQKGIKVEIITNQSMSEEAKQKLPAVSFLGFFSGRYEISHNTITTLCQHGLKPIN